MTTATSTPSLRAAYVRLLKLGMPVLFAQLGTIIVSLADTMMVGAYGTDELASAAFVNNLVLVPLVMQMGFAAGVTPLVGALYGAKKHFDVGRMLRVGLQLNILLGLILVAVMCVLYAFLDRMGQPTELLPLIRPYYLIVLSSMLTGSIYFPCMQMCNGVTDTATPMWAIIGANILNIVGNYALIFGHFGFPEMGLTGAGISTLAARFMCMASVLAVILHSRRYKPYRPGLFKRGGLRAERIRMFNTSWPVMVQSGVETFLWALGAVMCGWFAKQQLAGYQVVLSISQLGYMTYMSFANAVAIKVSNSLGRGDIADMKTTARAGLHLVLILATLTSVLFIFAGRELTLLFTTDRQVIAVCATLILPLVVYQYGDAIQMLYANALRGTGRVLPLVWISIVCYIVIGAVVMWILAISCGMQSRGVYFSFSAALFAAAWFMRRAFRNAVEQSAKNLVNFSL